MAEKLSEKIYNSIKKDIEDGRLDTREFFSEAQFAEKYNVSKAPVRDALHLLCSEGYMVSYHRKGYMVNSFSVDEINQIQTIRRAIEHLTIELVIKNATDEQIWSLYRYAEETSGGQDNKAFHMGLAQISGNKYLPDTLEGLLGKIFVAKRKVVLDTKKHRDILDALLERDEEKAVQCLNADISLL